MKNIIKNATDLVGNTPLIDLKRYREKRIIDKNKIYAKLEMFNPSGSVKDRIALSMIIDGEEKGILKKGSVIIEATSGNTGIGLSAIAAARGYRIIITMPETMSIERRKILSAYGAEIILTEGSKGMKGAIAKAEELNKEIKDSVILGQFKNKANVKAHYEYTGPEIWKDLDGEIDILVAGVGTGGTISGTGRFLKEKNENIQIVAVEPKDSPVLSGGVPGPHKIQGIGAGFIPEILDKSVIDEIIAVSTEEAIETARLLAASEGILVGISSGAALTAATKIAQRSENREKNIVVVLPDNGERYLSTTLYEKE